jgi:ATP-dependent protease ClpP protease subunit
MAEITFLPEMGCTSSFAEEMGNETYEEIMKYCDNNRYLIFNKDVDNSVIESFIIRILKWNDADKSIEPQNRKPITVFLNSCGGDLFSSLLFIDVIKTSKTPVRTVGMGLVASAAYYIYINGHERLAFENTVFLQHDGTIQIADSTSKVKDFMAFNDYTEERIKNMILKCTKISSDFFDKTFEKEYYFFADKGKELGVVDKILGVDESIGYIL